MQILRRALKAVKLQTLNLGLIYLRILGDESWRRTGTLNEASSSFSWGP